MTRIDLNKPLRPVERDWLVGVALEDLDAIVWGRADIDTMVRISGLANLAIAGMHDDIGKLDPEVFDPVVTQARMSCEKAVIGYRASGYLQVDQEGLHALAFLLANYDRMLTRYSAGTMGRIQAKARELCGKAIAAGETL